MTITAPRPAFTIAPDFTSENGVVAQGVPTIGAGESRALTLVFPSGQAGAEGARVRVRSMLMTDARKAFLAARGDFMRLTNTGTSAEYLRAKAAMERRALELKKALARTLDSYGVALDETNTPYVVASRYPALLEQHTVAATRPSTRPVLGIVERPTAMAAAA
ncbi:hypothetical protein [Curtobacterium sp. MCSS17_016]|uniref:hypothetical protein n=1 Tax=Curtobacterium sp. MCSS17_016 TaxID=2175644 RepID=UPI000DA732C0|nr:hypothetical protein [Curtobacterium sp. MCSS17_016]WIE81166.1 hypothetical protein DEJ19_018205 [Curtobacterium sp. MCSS17_016]